MLEKRANSNVSVDKRLRWPISHLSLQILIIWICTNLWHCQKKGEKHMCLLFSVKCPIVLMTKWSNKFWIYHARWKLLSFQLSVDLIWTISALWILNCSFNILKIQKRKTPLPDLTLFKNSKSISLSKSGITVRELQAYHLLILRCLLYRNLVTFVTIIFLIGIISIKSILILISFLKLYVFGLDVNNLSFNCQLFVRFLFMNCSPFNLSPKKTIGKGKITFFSL